MNDDQPARERFEKALDTLIEVAQSVDRQPLKSRAEVLRLWDEQQVELAEAERIAGVRLKRLHEVGSYLDSLDPAQPAAPVCGTCGGKGYVRHLAIAGGGECSSTVCPDCKPAAPVDDLDADVLNIPQHLRDKPAAQSEREAWKLKTVNALLTALQDVMRLPSDYSEGETYKRARKVIEAAQRANLPEPPR